MLSIAAFRYSRASHPVLKEVQQRVADVTTQAEENIVGVRVVKAFAQEPRQLRSFAAGTERIFSRRSWRPGSRRPTCRSCRRSPTSRSPASSSPAATRSSHGRLSLGSFFAVNGYLLLLVVPLRSIGMWVGQYQRAMASGERIFEVLDYERDILDAPGAETLGPGPGGIRMSGVRFGYDTGRAVLHDIDLDVAAGSTVALIGPTGCGKTTLTTLIPRFYDVRAGTIELDGQDVRRVTLRSLRAAVGIVSQDTFLFSTTVAENIAFGTPEATPEQIVTAARQAQAHEFICDLPDGYETVVGERGLSLSGGQRQRIAIARALLMNPRVLILDDATASVDASTEARIKLALREVMKGRTTVIIAHRLSTISLADEIVVLDKGRIVARGAHDELVQTSTVYREIHDHGLVERAVRRPRPRRRPDREGRRATRAAGGWRPAAVSTFGSHVGRLGAEPTGSRGARLAAPREGALGLQLAVPAPRGRRLVLMLVATATAIAGPLAVKAAIDRGIAASPADFGQIELWVGVFAALTVINWVTSSGQTYLTSWVGTRILADLRIGLFAHIQKLDLGFFERNRAGVRHLSAHQRHRGARERVVDGPTTLVQNTIVLVGSAGVLLYVNWKLAIATLTVFPGMAIGTAIFRYYSSRAYRQTRRRLAEVTGQLQEDISGVRVVQAFRREGTNYERFVEINGHYRAANDQTVIASAIYFPYVDLLSALAMAVVLGYGGTLVFQGDLTPGGLFVFIGLLSNFFDPVQQLSQFYQTFLAATAALDNIFTCSTRRPRSPTRPTLASCRRSAATWRSRTCTSRMPPAGQRCFTASRSRSPAGATIALVGHTGAGKSTS